MPLDLQTPLGRWGAGIGGAAGATGGGAASALSNLLEPLSWPRRLLWGALGAPEHGNELVGNLTGMDSDSALSHILGGAAEMVGDPLFLAPAAAGALGGYKAGRSYGKYLEPVARARGPMFEGGPEKLSGLVAGAEPEVAERFNELLASPHAKQILQEIQPGASVAGAGVEATVLKGSSLDGQGYVTRISGGPHTSSVIAQAENTPGAAPPGTPLLQELRQPGREVAIGPYRVSHYPEAELLGGATPELGQELTRAQKPLVRSAEAQGYGAEWPFRGDVHLNNIGRMGPGRYAVTDPGAVSPVRGGPDLPMPPDASPVEPGGWQRWLLDALGANRGVQQEMAQGLSRSAATSGISLPGVPAEAAQAVSQAERALSTWRPIRDQAFEELVAARQAGLRGRAIKSAEDSYRVAQAHIEEAQAVLEPDRLAKGWGTPLNPAGRVLENVKKVQAPTLLEAVDEHLNGLARTGPIG